ncbi:FRG domain-containing protein [Vibrio cyclitrophicus]
MSIEAFFSEVKSVSSELHSKFVWYRGHSCKEHRLLPTAYRQTRELHELGMFYDYKSHVAGINGCNKENWDLILDMQHYGLPTRLLDWTTSMGTAIYFALRNNPTTPCVWVLNPFELSKLSTDEDTIFDSSIMTPANPTSKRDFDLFNLLSGASKYQLPFSIQPPHGNRRIAAQRGMFTVHSKLRGSIEELAPNVVRRIDIPLDLIVPLQGYLEALGIDDYSMFPDQYGLSEFLKKKYMVQ